MIDQKVDEKFVKFQAEYEELKTSMKKNISGLMKSGLGANRATA